jgi:hypothetical protein
VTTDTRRAALAVDELRKYLADNTVYALGDHPPAPDASIADLIETYEWLIETRAHLMIEIEALRTGWRPEQIGALVIAATEAVDTVERLDEGVHVERIAKWRAAIARDPAVWHAPAWKGLSMSAADQRCDCDRIGVVEAMHEHAGYACVTRLRLDDGQVIDPSIDPALLALPGEPCAYAART